MMGISKNGTKKKFKIDGIWIALIVVVVIIAGLFATSAIASYASKSGGQRAFDQYVKAVSKQDVQKMAQTLYKQGSDDYNTFVEKFTEGKNAYEEFIEEFAPETLEYKEFMEKEAFKPDEEEDIRDYGLLLAVEQQIYSNIDRYEFTNHKQASYYDQFDVILIVKKAFVSTDYAVKYRDIISNNTFTSPFTLRFSNVNGEWNFLSSFSLLNKLGIVDTWFAPITIDGVEGYELKYLNPIDLDQTTANVKLDETSEPVDMTLGYYDTTLGHQGKPILKIADYAFSDCEELYEIVIADTITSVGEYAFKNCKWLTKLTYQDTSILDFDRNLTFAKGAFYNCERLESFVLPKINRIVPDYLLYGCSSITDFDIHFQTLAIGHFSFAFAKNLATINLPQSLTAIGDNAFTGCEKLYDINYYQGKTPADPIVNEISQNVTRIGANVFASCTSLTTIKLPNNLTKIENGTFDDAKSLSNVTFPQNLKSIGQNAFANTALSTFNAPQSLEVIASGAFSNSTLEEVVWSASPKIRIIGASAFENCSKIFKFILPKTVSQIGSNAFTGCPKLRVIEVYCSGNVSITSDTFSTQNGIPKFYVPNVNDYRSLNWIQLEVYPQSIIDKTDIEVAIMEQVRQTANGQVTDRILVQFLGGMNDKSINLDDYNITSIGGGAFAHAQYINDVTFTSANITSIGQDAFTGSTVKFTEYKNRSNDILYYLQDWLVLSSGPRALNGTLTAKYTSNTLDLRTSGNTSGFPTTGTSPLPATVGIASGAFYQTGNIRTINFPTSLKYIGDNAFSFSNNIATVDLSSSTNLLEIGNGAFEGCQSIVSLNIPQSVYSIGANTFKNCQSLRFVTINNDQKTLLGANAFTPTRENILKLYIHGYNEAGSTYRESDSPWQSYSTITFDADIKDGNFALQNNGNETFTIIQYLGSHTENLPGNINLSTLGVTISKIGTGAFATVNVGSVIIPHTVTDIESYAFYKCQKLSSVTMLAQGGFGGTDNLKHMGDYSFADTNLTNTSAEFVIEAERPNEDLAMGANVFDRTVERIVRVGKRANFIYISEGEHSAWSEYSNAIIANDDPKVFIVMDIDGSEIVHGNNIQTIYDRVTTKDTPVEYSNVPNSQLTFTANADTSKGYEFVGWYTYTLTDSTITKGELVDLDQENILVVDLNESGDVLYFMAVYQRVSTPIKITYLNGDQSMGDYSYTATSQVHEDGKIDLLDSEGNKTVVTFTATLEEGSTFEGWFTRDENGDLQLLTRDLILTINTATTSIEDLELYVSFL